MKARSFAVAAVFGASLIAVAVGPARAGACDPASKGNNPAFAEPRTCPVKAAPPPTVKPAAGGSATRPVEVRRENGKTVYSYGDTTIAVGGSVYGQIGTGGGQIRR